MIIVTKNGERKVLEEGWSLLALMTGPIGLFMRQCYKQAAVLAVLFVLWQSLTLNKVELWQASGFEKFLDLVGSGSLVAMLFLWIYYARRANLWLILRHRDEGWEAIPRGKGVSVR